MPLHVSSASAHRQEAKIVLYTLWYQHTETSEWSKITKITSDDEHLCSKHVEVRNKLIIKFSASSCLILR